MPAPIYQTGDGQAEVKLGAEDGSVRLSQIEIAELFATTKQNVSLHARNILAEGKLASGVTVKESLTVRPEVIKWARLKLDRARHSRPAEGHRGHPLRLPQHARGKSGRLPPDWKARRFVVRFGAN